MLPILKISVSAVKALHGDVHSLVVLIHLALFRESMNAEKTHFMTKLEIAKRSGVSRSQVYKSLKKLCDLGLIEELAERRGEYIYRLNCVGVNDLSASRRNEEEAPYE